MAGSTIPHILVAFCAVLAINYVSSRPKDESFPSADEDGIENLESMNYPESMNNLPLKMPEDKPKNCFHFFVSRNMSSLLAEATKMLRTIRDRREREWILTFIYRIKNLAEHLRSHPESRNYDCLPTGDESRKRILNNDVRGQQSELYFVDDILKRSDEGENQQEKAETHSKDSQDSRKFFDEQSAMSKYDDDDDLILAKETLASTPATEEENFSEVYAGSMDNSEAGHAEEEKNISKKDVSVRSEEGTHTTKTFPSKTGYPPADNSIVLSSAPDCDTIAKCERDSLALSQNMPDKYFADAGEMYPQLYTNEITKRQQIIADLYEQALLKKRIRKALMEELSPEIKKLRTVGGTEEDLMHLWNINAVAEDKSMEDSETDFDYEEMGAAAGDLNMNEKIQPDRTVAPSLYEVRNSKENSNNPKDSSYEPYDDSDVLVQQLFDVRYNDPPSKTTKSLNDQNDEYLITSTITPF